MVYFHLPPHLLMVFISYLLCLFLLFFESNSLFPLITSFFLSLPLLYFHISQDEPQRECFQLANFRLEISPPPHPNKCARLMTSGWGKTCGASAQGKAVNDSNLFPHLTNQGPRATAKREFLGQATLASRTSLRFVI